MKRGFVKRSGAPFFLCLCAADAGVAFVRRKRFFRFVHMLSGGWPQCFWKFYTHLKRRFLLQKRRENDQEWNLVCGMSGTLLWSAANQLPLNNCLSVHLHINARLTASRVGNLTRLSILLLYVWRYKHIYIYTYMLAFFITVNNKSTFFRFRKSF